jgi:hypothetical protein
MRSGIVAVITGVVLVVAATAASAQTPSSPRFSIGGTAGFGQTWDDEGSIGTGWLAGGYGQVRLFGHTDAEFSVDVLRHNRDSGAFQAEGHTTFVSAALRQRFGGERTKGYLLGGFTIGSHSGTAGFPAYNMVNDYSSTRGGFVFGGGLNFTVGDAVEIGPVIRITMLGTDADADPWSSIMTGVRIGIRR